MVNIFFFIPDNLQKQKKGYLEGFHKKFQDSEAYYVINNQIHPKPPEKCIGYIGPRTKNRLTETCELFYNSQTGEITPSNARPDSGCKSKITKIIYNYKAFKGSKVIDDQSDNFGDHFKSLVEFLRDDKRNSNGRKSVFISVLLYLLDHILRVFEKWKSLVKSSSTLSHFQDNLETIKFLVNEANISPTWGNILLAKLIDLFLGVCFFWYLTQHESVLVNFIGNSTETIVINLKQLLLYLMGSPIGLKLNYAFNNSLGTFFFYHISLWRIFLQGLQPVFYHNFKILVLPSILGLSFEIAILSDVVSVTTFHMYCIYVYAARLFNLQLRGITSLWRLFIGQKYNPLRERVDSCQYSHHELFIGTLGFTILLFLLPTTGLYYTVFTLLRILILLINETLLNIRYLLKCLPIYLFCLWIIKSNSLAGCLSLRSNGSDHDSHLEAQLNIIPLNEILKKSTHSITSNSTLKTSNFSCSSLFSKLFKGSLL